MLAAPTHSPLPPRYRLRDLIMGDYAFNDDGVRSVQIITVHDCRMFMNRYAELPSDVCRSAARARSTPHGDFASARPVRASSENTRTYAYVSVYTWHRYIICSQIMKCSGNLVWFESSTEFAE